MLILTVWLAIMAGAGLCYPRRPRTSGVLFLAAGGFMFIAWAAGAIGNPLPLNATISATLGFGQLWKFRDSSIRAAHVPEWTGKA